MEQEPESTMDGYEYIRTLLVKDGNEQVIKLYDQLVSGRYHWTPIEVSYPTTFIPVNVVIREAGNYPQDAIYYTYSGMCVRKMKDDGNIGYCFVELNEPLREVENVTHWSYIPLF